MELLSGILFCCSVSLDGFTIGCSYGIRKLKSTVFTNIISAVICASASALAIFFGSFFLTVLSEETCTLLGVILLSCLGLYILSSGLFSSQNTSVPEIARPMSHKESIFLSLAVSVDAFSAGLGYAMMGHTSYFIPLGVGLFHSFFISLGIGLSRYAIGYFNLSKRLLGCFSGLIIMAVALFRVVF